MFSISILLMFGAKIILVQFSARKIKKTGTAGYPQTQDSWTKTTQYVYISADGTLVKNSPQFLMVIEIMMTHCLRSFLGHAVYFFIKACTANISTAK